MAQIQFRKRVPDLADYAGRIRQHEPDNTRSGMYLPYLAYLDHEL